MAPETVQNAVVRKTLHVEVPVEKAFQIFTQRMGAWWPASHHVGKTPFRDVIVEPKAGGRWYEINVEDVEIDWGSVVAYEPPKRVVLGWHLQPDFHFDADPAKASEVVLEFVKEGPEKTRVEFEHRHLERHGEGWQKLAADVNGGWDTVLAGYVKLANPAV